MNWIMPANGKMYRHAEAFDFFGFIDWRDNGRKYEIGDVIYIYCAKPYKRIMYKTLVEKILLNKNQIVNDKMFWLDESEYEKSLYGTYARLRLIERVNSPYLGLDCLLNHGLNSAPFSARKISSELQEYIEKYMDDNYHENVFPDSANTDICIEGAKVQVFVNKYERSSLARQRCIEYHGCYCHVCKLDFEKTYGEVGKDFIHIHHLKPLNEISEEYIVDYKKDLIPVCPNCHAMLHREINGKYLSIDELKKLIKNNK